MSRGYSLNRRSTAWSCGDRRQVKPVDQKFVGKPKNYRSLRDQNFPEIAPKSIFRAIA
ncbi:hypothetical protein H6F44_03170 [Pseudanabaena sp. FACHB-1277]|uniref:Uncharacterized protein n=1 Tax=Pseudanabaena cinerea FACHB-1277 TaxID=2949581 RepID=A0A926UQ29_9CYAN|nr:hypothetical protein [Pseudanabaena cinerea]MBD2149130.1 hypothetical protein [Pseudanabaena cinerea FACHB-1277]